MRLKPTLYLVHRWIAAVVSLQLLAWSLGGLIFTLLPIDDVRGTTDARTTEPPSLRADGLIAPAEALAGHPDATELRLLMRGGRAVYDLYGDGQPMVSLDARSGELLSPISPAAAQAVALADFLPGATSAEVELLREDPPLEYRGRPLPVYRVRLDHAKRPNIYVSPVTGEVLTRRNADWRLFDFFWMLHIMDYGDREDFNHPLLTSMSVLAVLTSISGLILWAWRAPRRRRR